MSLIDFRTYRRKTDSKPLTPQLLEEARQLINRGVSKRKAADEVGVKESTLRKRLKKGFGVNNLGRYKSTFTPEQEVEILQHCKDLEARFYGLSFKALRHLAFIYAVRNQITHRFDINAELAGKEWARSFIKRHGLCLRQPQKTSIARIMGFNEVQVNNYFDNLEALMRKHTFPPSRVYNMDESGIQTVPGKLCRIVSTKGKRNVNKAVAADKGQTISIACAMSATGNYIPPALIFARKRQNPALMHGAPPGSVSFVSDRGYMTVTLFIEWLQHFKKNASPTQENPVLLILDNHVSHISLEAVTFAKENHIHLLSLPPHSSQKTQPLDRCFFKPLKARYDELCDQWSGNHAGASISQYNIAEIFGQAFMRVATVDIAAKAFRTCGIVPLNRYIFTHEDFLPSAVTDQNFEMTVDEIDVEDMSIINFNSGTAADPAPAPSGSIPLQSDVPSTSAHPAINTEVSHESSPTYNLVPTNIPVLLEPSTAATPESSSTDPSTSNHPAPVCLVPQTPAASSCRSMVAASTEEAEVDQPQPLEQTHVSPAEIIPLPKVQVLRQRRKRGLKSQILTGTPHKTFLEEQRKRQEQEEKQKNLRRSLFQAKSKKSSKTKTNPNAGNPSSSTGRKDKEIKCPACDELFEDPPTEDWIQCSVCQEWWHEDCTAYEGGIFVCEYC